jgi:hypothetical protein
MRSTRKHMPADKGTNAARFDDIQVVHNGCVDGFSLFAGNAVWVLAGRFDNESLVRTSL